VRADRDRARRVEFRRTAWLLGKPLSPFASSGGYGPPCYPVSTLRTIRTETVSSSPVKPQDVSLVITLPSFNDWGALVRLLPALDETLSGASMHARILVIDDGSTEPAPPTFGSNRFQALSAVHVLRLRRNLGHQRAIAVALAYIERNMSCDAVVVMDADGEDAPGDVPRLVERMVREGHRAIVFAERSRRVERPLFRILYHLYRLLHRVLTGRAVRVGNFSVIPRARLDGLVVVSELWNHYAAAVFRSRQPYVSIPTNRAARLEGRSRMNWVSLVVHGMSAISVYGDIVFVRLIVFAALLVSCSALGLGAVLGIRLFTSLAIPGWATFASGILVLVLLQAVLFVAVLTFLGLNIRQQAPFVPSRDFEWYVDDVWPAPDGARCRKTREAGKSGVSP
jgi:polyisoprenyl-phosphate glycosyltransferase